MIAEELSKVTSHLSAGPAETAQSPNYGAILQQYVNQFVSDVSQGLLTIDDTVVTITKLAFVTLLLLGVFLYFTRLHRRLGKDLIYGGVVLGIMSQVVFPLLNI